MCVCVCEPSAPKLVDLAKGVIELFRSPRWMKYGLKMCLEVCTISRLTSRFCVSWIKPSPNFKMYQSYSRFVGPPTIGLLMSHSRCLVLGMKGVCWDSHVGWNMSMTWKRVYKWKTSLRLQADIAMVELDPTQILRRVLTIILAPGFVAPFS